MNRNPRELAVVIVKFPFFPESLGMMVRVVGPSCDKFSWVEFLAAIPAMKGRVEIADEYLCPISGVPIHEEQHDEVPA